MFPWTGEGGKPVRCFSAHQANSFCIAHHRDSTFAIPLISRGISRVYGGKCLYRISQGADKRMNGGRRASIWLGGPAVCGVQPGTNEKIPRVRRLPGLLSTLTGEARKRGGGGKKGSSQMRHCSNKKKGPMDPHRSTIADGGGHREWEMSATGQRWGGTREGSSQRFAEGRLLPLQRPGLPSRACCHRAIKRSNPFKEMAATTPAPQKWPEICVNSRFMCPKWESTKLL